ncbi:hypothetical protein B0H11DRAFT_2235570 [Mycena galericulata]|nr:hypothetical protein B0H11DRAFT_2235570 [Mycena galericulata]
MSRFYDPFDDYIVQMLSHITTSIRTVLGSCDTNLGHLHLPVAYTVSHYSSSSKDSVYFNIRFVVVISTPNEEGEEEEESAQKDEDDGGKGKAEEEATDEDDET